MVEWVSAIRSKSKSKSKTMEWNGFAVCDEVLSEVASDEEI
jgi:hypothetical protein